MFLIVHSFKDEPTITKGQMMPLKFAWWSARPSRRLDGGNEKANFALAEYQSLRDEIKKDGAVH